MPDKLKNYIDQQEITDSAYWVALRTLLIFAHKRGSLEYIKFLEYFCNYYQRRLDAGLPTDQEQTLLGNTTDLSKNIIDHKISAIIEGNTFLGRVGENKEVIGFNKKVWDELTDGDKVMLVAIIEEKLEEYFSNKVPHRFDLLPVPCVFCNRDKLRVIKENDLAFTVFDIFPAVPGHCLIIPKRHVRDIFGLTPEEIGGMLELLKEMQDVLEERYMPNGYNVGFNVGYAAGQTVMHAHMHCFPRKWGDVDNPRGGMRNIIPNWFKYAKS